MNVTCLSKRIKSTILVHEPLYLHTSWRVGGPADIFVQLAHSEDVRDIIDFTNRNNLPLFVLGRGTNLLVNDGGIRGVTVSVSSLFGNFCFHDGVLEAQGGASLSRLVKAAADAGLTGLEFAAGIPGSVAGALAMNAGAHGGSMADIFLKAVGVSREGEEVVLSPEDIDFSYRYSTLQERQLVITTVMLHLAPGDKDEIGKNVAKFVSARRARQPKGASAGSVFKNPRQGPAGFYIEQAGLKGLVVGGARISEKHANFILNTGNATAKDILSLIERVKEEVSNKFGIVLETEVRVVGE